MKQRLEIFKTERTKIMSEMFDNPDNCGIYPTTKCFEALDKLYSELCRKEAIAFGAEYAYRKANPEGKMDVPSIVYENAESYYDKKFDI